MASMAVARTDEQTSSGYGLGVCARELAAR